MFAAKTKLMCDAMRLVWIFSVACCVIVLQIAGGSSSFAESSKKYPGLASGLEFMSAYSSLHPKAKEAFDKVLERAPPDVRKQVEASNWAARQRAMTPKQLEDAATDSRTSLLPTADGLAAIPTEKFKNAISGLTDFAIDQKETLDFLNSIRDSVPNEHKKTLSAAIKGLNEYNESKAKAPAAGASSLLGKIKERGRQALENVARTAITGAASYAAGEQAKVLTDKVRDKVNADGAAGALDAYRKAATERKRRIAQQAAVAAKAKREAEKQRKAMADINGLLGKLSATNARQKIAIAVCEGQAAALPDLGVPQRLAERIGRGAFLRSLAEQALKKADRVEAGAQGLRKIITQVEQTAATVCANPKATSNPDTRQRLGALRGVARGTRDGIIQQIDEAIADLNRPIGTEALRNLIANVKHKRGQCDARPKGASSGLRYGISSSHLGALANQQDQVTNATRAIRGLSIASAISIKDSMLLAARLAQIDHERHALQQRFDQCSDKVLAADKACKALNSDSDVARLMKQEAELLDFDRRRQAALQRVLSARSAVETDFQTANRATRKAEACIKQPESDQNKSPKPELAAPRTRDPKDVADAVGAACRRKLQTPRARVRFRNGEWRCFLPTNTPHERDALKTCRDQYGRGSLPNLAQSSYKTYVCYCVTGYKWNANKTYCDRAPTTASATPGGAPSKGSDQSGQQPGQTGSSTTGASTAGTASCGAAPVGGKFNLKHGHCAGPGSASGVCPIVPGWVMPAGAACGDAMAGGSPSTPVPTTGPASDVAPGTSTPSTASATPGLGSRSPPNVGTPTRSSRPATIPPPPSCRDKSCKMVGAQFVNGGWITGHCLCPNLGRR